MCCFKSLPVRTVTGQDDSLKIALGSVVWGFVYRSGYVLVRTWNSGFSFTIFEVNYLCMVCTERQWDSQDSRVG